MHARRFWYVVVVVCPRFHLSLFPISPGQVFDLDKTSFSASAKGGESRYTVWCTPRPSSRVGKGIQMTKESKKLMQ